jgi:hypothetical protein
VDGRAEVSGQGWVDTWHLPTAGHTVMRVALGSSRVPCRLIEVRHSCESAGQFPLELVEAPVPSHVLGVAALVG